MTRILVTGAAGFIGFHLARRFAERGDEVLGIDNLNDYYDVSLKQARLRLLEPLKGFRFVRMDIAERSAMEELFAKNSFDRVVHMAAQAGVRYSLVNPHAYVQSNLVGFMNVLEGCRRQWTRPETRNPKPETARQDFVFPGPGSRVPGPELGFHLVYASSSSVYGLNAKMPFSVNDPVDHPISLYGVTKRANELMAHTYSYLYGIPTTGLRFFTVYGPWGRPDMALFKFTKAILAGEPIDVYNEGRMERDFTYIDDIVEGVVRVTDRISGPETRDLRLETSDHRPQTSGLKSQVSGLRSQVPYKIYNIGNHSPVGLMDFIHTIEDALGKKARLNFLPLQPGDVPVTYADVDDLMCDVGFAPKTPIKEGVRRFVEWYGGCYE